MDYLELVRPASLSIVLFRRLGWDAERYGAWSQQLLRDQIAFVTPTKWRARPWRASRSYTPTPARNSWFDP